MSNDTDSRPYILYGGGVTRAIGPQMVLEQADICYELRVLDEHKGEHRTPEYLAINPAGYIPALVTPEGEVLHEAAAIMIYLAERHCLSDLIPGIDDPDRALFFCRLFYQTNDIQPAMRRFFKPSQYSTDPGHALGIKQRARDVAMDRWSVLNAFLKRNGPYNLGGRFSIADLHMTLWAAYGLNSVDTITDAFPAVKLCFDLTSGRPRIQPLVDTLQSRMRTWKEEK